MKRSNSMFIKGAVLAFIALQMLIPLFMVENQIRERRRNAESCRAEVSQSWSNAQTLAAIMYLTRDLNSERTEG